MQFSIVLQSGVSLRSSEWSTMRRCTCSGAFAGSAQLEASPLNAKSSTARIACRGFNAPVRFGFSSPSRMVVWFAWLINEAGAFKRIARERARHFYYGDSSRDGPRSPTATQSLNRAVAALGRRSGGGRPTTGRKEPTLACHSESLAGGWWRRRRPGRPSSRATNGK